MSVFDRAARVRLILSRRLAAARRPVDGTAGLFGEAPPDPGTPLSAAGGRHNDVGGRWTACLDGGRHRLAVDDSDVCSASIVLRFR